METIATLIAMFAGVMSLVRHQTREDNVFLLIAAGFFGTSVLDGYHAIVTASGVSEYLPSALPSLIPWSWLASRCFLSFCLFLSWLAWRRGRDRPVVSNTTIYVGTSAFALASFVFFACAPLPPAYYPDLVLHRPAEWIAGLFFCLALFGYASKGTWRHDLFERMLICSLLLAVIDQLVVMPRSASLFDSMFDLAHILKIASYTLVAVGLTGTVVLALAEVQRLNLERKQHVAELAHANEGLEAFLRTASHDLKAPLRHIYGFCGFVRRDAADRLSENETEDLQRAMDAASHMSNLLDSLLGFAKLGVSSLRYEPFSLAEVVEQVVARLPAEQQARVVHSNLGLVAADKRLLTLVLQNLIENGLKYVRDPSARVTIQSASSPEGIQVSVADQGIGLERAQWKRIFEPGIRGVSDTEFEGTGFGLATCRTDRARASRRDLGRIKTRAGFRLPLYPSEREGKLGGWIAMCKTDETLTALRRVHFRVLDRPRIDQLFKLFLLDLGNRRVESAVEQFAIHHGTFPFQVENTRVAVGPDDHFQTAVLVASAARLDSQVIAKTGRSPADFAEQGLLTKPGKVIGDAMNGALDSVGQGESIRRMQPSQLFLAQLFLSLLGRL